MRQASRHSETGRRRRSAESGRPCASCAKPRRTDTTVLTKGCSTRDEAAALHRRSPCGSSRRTPSRAPNSLSGLTNRVSHVTKGYFTPAAVHFTISVLDHHPWRALPTPLTNPCRSLGESVAVPGDPRPLHWSNERVLWRTTTSIRSACCATPDNWPSSCFVSRRHRAGRGAARQAQIHRESSPAASGGFALHCHALRLSCCNPSPT